MGDQHDKSKNNPRSHRFLPMFSRRPPPSRRTRHKDRCIPSYPQCRQRKRCRPGRPHLLSRKGRNRIQSHRRLQSKAQRNRNLCPRGHQSRTPLRHRSPNRRGHQNNQKNQRRPPRHRHLRRRWPRQRRQRILNKVRPPLSNRCPPCPRRLARKNGLRHGLHRLLHLLRQSRPARSTARHLRQRQTQTRPCLLKPLRELPLGRLPTRRPRRPHHLQRRPPHATQPHTPTPIQQLPKSHHRIRTRLRRRLHQSNRRPHPKR